MAIFSQKPTAFGLDISDLSLKIAKLEKKRGGLKLASFGQAKIPKGVIKGGEVKDEKALGEIIKKSLAEVQGKKIKTKYVVLSLPEEKSFLDILQIPVVKKEELEMAVRFEAENHIPLPLTEVYFDFEEIEPVFAHPKYLEVLIAATPQKIVDPYLAALKEADLEPQVLEVECLAIVRALVKEKKTTRPLLIIDFGETRTSFVIFSGKSIRFTSTIPVSSRGLTESIAKNLKISFKKAEKLKIEQGLEGEKEVFEAMIPPLTDLVEQIKTYLEYYHSHIPKDQLLHDGKELEKILLCGGGSLLKGLDGFLSSSLKITVELGNPWANILAEPLKEVPELSFKESIKYTTALGLALRGVYGY
jgi:type IV pilus assembly protein PilM